jgi:2-polyprenyl-3-methyl-5-hydroxy-6-metoxy-1,4-benzoquinol methylase
MNPEDIGKNYDQIAGLWHSDVFPPSQGIQQHERAIAFVTKKLHALDIGCGGSGRFIDLLRSHGFNVEGVDISEQMIRLARQRHPDVAFHHGDIRQWIFRRSYDFISAWDSLWHLPLREQAPVLRRVLRGLAPDGVCIFTTGGLDVPSEKVDSAMGLPMYYSTLGIPRTLEVLSEAGCICRHLEYDQYPESHLYLIAQKA